MKKKIEKLPTIWFSTSDNHVGQQSVEQAKKEYFDEDEGFFSKMNEVHDYCVDNEIKFGGVAICGDYFNHQLSLNSSHAKFAMDLMHAILHTAITLFDGTVILIQGTRSHDLSQINIFEPFMTEFEGKFFIVNTVQELHIDGYDILCLPEEYMTNPTEYYSEFFAKKYDLCFGHGFFKWNCFNKNEIERPMPGMPIFDQDEICKMVRVTIFGHDHTFQNYRECIYYNGSYSRMCHGDEGPKGALMVYIDADSHEVHQLENTLTPSFLSVYLEKIVKGDLNYETAVKAINKVKKGVEFLKIKVSQDTVLAQPTMVELIKDFFATQQKRGIIIDAPPFTIKNGKTVMLCEEPEGGAYIDETGEAVVVETKRVNEEMAFLFESAIPVDEKVHRFIQLKHDDKVEISLDDIRDAISSNK